MRYSGADWIQTSLGVKEISEHGKKVADILGQVWRGIYHLPSASLRKINWKDPDVIQLNLWHELATFDHNSLTELVVLCHDRSIRFSINPCNMRYIRLCFHRRYRDEEHQTIFQRHPTIEQAITDCRKIWEE